MALGNHARFSASVITVFAVVVAGLIATPLVASADDLVSPDGAVGAQSTLPEPVSADGLPTVQIDEGVVWAQAVAGDIVYAGGQFSNARPAGAAKGTQLVPRSNILAYNIKTGALVQSFNPVINNRVSDMAVSPDGTKLFVVGTFTAVNGQTRNRVAVFDLPSGNLSTTLIPTINGTAQSVAATNDTLYLGGYFSSVNGSARARVAAVSTVTGKLLPFRPVVDNGMVQSITVGPGGSQVVLSGSFTSVEGSSEPGFGLARVDGVTGASMSLPVNSQVRNAGQAAGILNVATDGEYFYGVGWHFNGTGNSEGTFAARWTDGSLVWLEDCHGDTYDVAPIGDLVYTASHKHYCGNSGGFPQSNPWSFKHSTVWTKSVQGTNTADIYGYPDHPGTPRPAMLNWYPQTEVGNFTGKGQAVWTVTGNQDYVVYGGEFPRVNGVTQQGLVRYAVRGIAPNKQGPRSLVDTETWTPSVLSVAAGSARVSYTTVWDRDDTVLTYRLYRDSENPAGLIDERVVDTTFWQPLTQKVNDTDLVAGSSVQYRVTATDPSGNVLRSPWTTVTISDAEVGPYSSAVLNDGAEHYWRLGESSGNVGFDWTGNGDLSITGSVARAMDGAISADPDKATRFDNAFAASSASTNAPNNFSTEMWFKTTTKSGGKLIGYGNSATGNSGSYDRHLYMENSGKLTFGVYPGGVRTITSTAAYNDGNWHQAVTSLGSNGMELYVDGKRVAQRSDVTVGQDYSGFWRVGGDNLSGWSNQPSSNNFAGTLDEVSIYPNSLTPSQVQAHYTASGRSLAIPEAPGDAYGRLVYDAAPSVYWRFDEASGAALKDSGQQGAAGSLDGDYARGAAGAVVGGGSAITFKKTTCGFWDFGCKATNGGNGFTTVSERAPGAFSVETWFKTTSTAGGKLIGFGNAQTGSSSNYDRHVYMDDNGKLSFGTFSTQRNLATSAAAYNDGAWHHVVATQGADGMVLYVDGVAVGTNPATQAQTYDGYWRVGGDASWGGTSPNMIGSFDEAAVYSRALTAPEVAAHFQVGVGAEAPNLAPVASYTAVATHLELSVDATGSSDSDGTIVDYSWNFGDGGTATGVTADHTFAEAGTYAVSLTVTDDKNASSTYATDMAVTAEPENVAPVAVFVHSSNDLNLSVDAGGSSDSDGSVASYSWAFGDGGTADGVTASHAFAEAGTYTVVLTVTDDRGATATSSADVTVVAPEPPAEGVLASDGFDRAVANGWGTADVGGDWTLRGAASRFSVADGVGKLSMPAAQTLYADLNSVSATDARVDAVFSVDKLVEAQYVSVVGRRVGSNNYLVRLRLQADGGVKMYLLQDGNLIGGAYTVPDLTMVPGEQYALSMEVTGTAPTTLKAKVWPASQPEPGWQREGTNSFAALQAPGAVSVFSFLPSTTLAPVVVAFDKITVSVPTAD